MDITVADAPEASRYEARLGDDLAGVIDYRRDGEVLDLTHTEVQPQHEGKGVASQLVRGALDDVRRRGVRVHASCSYVRHWVEKNPGYEDVVTA